MVFDTSGKGKKKYERKLAKGKLIGITTDSSKGKSDREQGLYEFVDLAILDNSKGQDKWFNIRVSKNINMKELKELDRADQMLRNKERPFVEVEYYEREVVAIDKITKKPIMIEEITERNGKEVILQKEKRYLNLRATSDDIKNSFKILKKQPEQSEEVLEIEEEMVS